MYISTEVVLFLRKYPVSISVKVSRGISNSFYDTIFYNCFLPEKECFYLIFWQRPHRVLTLVCEFIYLIHIT